MNQIANARELLMIYLDDLYNSEEVLQEALSNHLTIATSENLKREISEYLDTCQKKKESLEQIYKNLQIQIRSGQCKILGSILEETKELTQSTAINHLKDAALMAGIQNINNFKIGRYRTLCGLVNQLQLNHTLSVLGTLRGMEETTREILSWLANKQLFKDAAEIVDYRE